MRNRARTKLIDALNSGKFSLLALKGREQMSRFANYGWAMLMLSCATSLTAHAQTPAEFFKGRQLTLLVGGGSGGSVDIYGRLLARHIVRFLPGEPVVVVKNLPSAGGIRAYMTLGTTAPRDGSVFSTSARGPLTDPILSLKPAAYDPRRFIWIGAMNDDSSVCYTAGHSKVRSLDDARKIETTMASTGVLAESSKFPVAINEIVGTKFKVITGYRGAAQGLLAVEKGETDGRCTTIGSLLATQPHILKDERYRFLIQVGETKHPAVPDSPLVTDFAKTHEDKLFLDLIIKPLTVTSSFVLPEGVPQDRVVIWRTAFQDTIRDPQFVADGRRVGLDITPRTAEEVTKVIHDLYNLPPSVVERARKVFGYKSAE